MHIIFIDNSNVPAMNPYCFICETPATRVCVHLDCDEVPFLCEGGCIKNTSLETRHTRDNSTRFLLLGVVGKINLKSGQQPPSGPPGRHGQGCQESSRPAAESAAGSRKSKLSKEVRKTVDNIHDLKSNGLVKGRELHKLVRREGIFERESEGDLKEAEQVMSGQEDGDCSLTATHSIKTAQAQIHFNSG